MILKHKAELAGRVKLQISGGERGTIDYDWFDNMILDQGLISSITTVGHQYPYVAVGASSTPVSAQDTGLFTVVARGEIANTGYPPVGYDAEGGFGWTRSIVTFARGVAAGNLSEVGLFKNNNNVSAFARALIKDSSGNPTTITVLPDEVLTVTWEVRRYWQSPQPHDLLYQVDGVDKLTTVSYVQSANIGVYGLSSAGHEGMSTAWSLVSGFTAQRSQTFSESELNGSVTTLRSVGGANRMFVYSDNYATLNPPIAKTNEFRMTVNWQLTLSRRGE